MYNFISAPYSFNTSINLDDDNDGIYDSAEAMTIFAVMIF